MAIMTKCDRCGTLYETSGKHPYSVYDNTPSPLVIRRRDLCDTCLEKLEIFMSGCDPTTEEEKEEKAWNARSRSGAISSGIGIETSMISSNLDTIQTGFDKIWDLTNEIENWATYMESNVEKVRERVDSINRTKDELLKGE